MRELAPPDSHHLNAAAGWLELGDAGEAHAELEKISPTLNRHPDVLELKWRICAGRKQWDQALEIARAIIEEDPADPGGWIHQSDRLHELQRTREAQASLLPVVDRFPDVSTIPYNLACYACRLGDIEQAREWLAKATRIRNKDEVKRVALADEDLEPLWGEIRKL